MAFFGAALDLGIAIFFVAALAEYAKIRTRIEKPLGFLAAGGLLFVLEASFANLSFTGFDISVLTLVFNGVGILFVLIGTLLSAYKLVAEK